jgi:hypothetical protein
MFYDKDMFVEAVSSIITQVSILSTSDSSNIPFLCICVFQAVLELRKKECIHKGCRAYIPLL